MAGNCLKDMPRYCYDPETGMCDKFMFGGCGGNANNFISAEECMRQCSDGTLEDGEGRYKVDG